SDRTNEAVEAYHLGLEADPEDARLHESLGLLLARTGAPHDAEIEIREAIRLVQRPSPALETALGNCLADEGRLTEAEDAYTRAVALDPQQPAARNARALVWLDAGRVGEARRELVALTEAFPSFAEAENNLALIAIDERDWT